MGFLHMFTQHWIQTHCSDIPSCGVPGLLKIIGYLGLYCLSMPKTSICQVLWTFTVLLVNSDTCHPFVYFLAILRGLNYYIVIDILFSPPSLSFLPYSLPSFLQTTECCHCFCLSTEEDYIYAWDFPRGTSLPENILIKIKAQKYQNIQFSKNIQG